MLKKAIFPGSFDPITKGHEAIVLRALPLFDEIIIAIGHNTTKQTSFTLEKRLDMLKKVFGHEPKIKIEYFEGLTVDYCKKNHISFILRGLRNSSDFNYEQSIAQMNRTLNPNVETMLLFCDPEFSAISSTIVREIIKSGGNPSPFIPKALENELNFRPNSPLERG